METIIALWEEINNAESNEMRFQLLCYSQVDDAIMLFRRASPQQQPTKAFQCFLSLRHINGRVVNARASLR